MYSLLAVPNNILSFFRTLFDDRSLRTLREHISAINSLRTIPHKHLFLKDTDYIKTFSALEIFYRYESISEYMALSISDNLDRYGIAFIDRYIVKRIIDTLLVFKFSTSERPFAESYVLPLLPYLEKVYHLEYSNRQFIKSLCAALESRDSYTKGHSDRVSRYADAIACEYYESFYSNSAHGFGDKWQDLGAEEFAERIRIAGLLHDLGKIGIDSSLTIDRKLDDREFNLMRAHVRESAKIVEKIDNFRELGIDRIVKEHHENYDGSGYLGLKGNDIHIGARIIAVADSFDAMTSNRPYRKRLSVEWSADELRHATFYDKKYHIEVFWAFEKAILKGTLTSVNDMIHEEMVNYRYVLQKFYEELSPTSSSATDFESCYLQRYEAVPELRCCHRMDRELICCERYTLKILARHVQNIGRDGMITLGFAKVPSDPSPFVAKVKELLKVEGSWFKDIGFLEAEKVLLIFMEDREDKIMYNILCTAARILPKGKGGREEKLTALIKSYQHQYFEALMKELEEDFSEAIAALNREKAKDRVLYYGDI